MKELRSMLGLSGILSERKKRKMIFDENRHYPADTFCQQPILITIDLSIRKTSIKKT